MSNNSGARSIWVKICATTSLADAITAWQTGADAIGFILDPRSPRYVTPEHVAAIIQELARPIERIGVIMNLAVRQAIDLYSRCGMSGVQLHGDESPGFVRDLRAALPDARIIKSLRGASTRDELQAAVRLYQQSGADALLLDSHAAGQGGGTGTRFPWNVAASALQNLDAKLPIIIAGGLSPDNVSDAVNTFHPFGVDVVTGVEIETGKKDAERVRLFVRNARQAATLVNAGTFALRSSLQ